MKNGWITFIVCFIVAFAGGYVFYESVLPATASKGSEAEAPAVQEARSAVQAEAKSETVSAEGEIFKKLNCIACHSISSLDVKAGEVGPDLSQAYVNVKNKHGVELEEFLKKPTSAVMSGVIDAKPLSDEERQQVIAALKSASEKK